MRFASTHKVVSYLMVTTAFLVLALSGELPSELTALTSLGIFGSFFFDPQRHPFMNHRLYRYGWNVAMIVVMGLSVMAWIRAEPLLGVGTRFLCCLLLAKMWNRKANRDYLHAYLISFFMLVAGSVLNNSLAYAACFVCYVIFTTWTLTLFHLRREMEENYLLKHLPSKDGKVAESERVEVDRILNSRRVVGGSFLFGTSLISLAIFLSSAIIFLLTPRIGMGLDIPLQRHGYATSGFSDRIELGGHGRIRDNPQVVMRIELPAGRPERPLYLRGVTFDQYDRGHWSRSKRIDDQPLGRYLNYYVVGQEAGALTWPSVQKALGRSVRAEIYLEPLDVGVLFVPSVAVAVVPPEGLYPSTSVHLRSGPGGEIFAQDHKGGVRYTAYSNLAAPDEKRLRSSPPLPIEHAEDLDAYLEVPSTLPERVRRLALQIAGRAASPHEKVLLLLGYLQRSYAYTVILQRDEKFEPLEDFLFVQKQGHCEYFASALAMMLRVVGVPSRSVNGYLGGEWNEYGRYMVVRQQNAHAWVEAYLEGVGWVTYDPTPPSALPQPESGMWSKLRQLGDTMEMSWFKYVIEYDLRTQVQIAESALTWMQKNQGRRYGLGLRDKLRWARARAPYVAACALGGAALLWVALRLRRRLPVLGWPQGQRTDHLLRQAMLQLKRRGFSQRPAETLQQLAARITAAGDPTGPPFDRLVDRYYACRFGGDPVDMKEFRELTRGVLRAPLPPPPPPREP